MTERAMADFPATERIRVSLEHESQVLRIVLASPPANILDAACMAEIVACLDHHANEAGIKALVFEGEGKHFCFGASVEEHQKEQAGAMIASFHGLFEKLLAFGAPTVALVRGQCLGGGMELASFCNFVLAEPKAKFGQPEIQLAVFPPVAAAILPGIIGQSRADDLVLTGRSIDAQTAHAWGLVHALAEDGEALLQELLKSHLLPKSAESLRHANRAVRRDWYENLAARLDAQEKAYVQELMETEDANEGIGAFLQKRKPAWKNR
jgi:cyclohexa-1,5-dienecarbonyl-CoA hydratase